MLTRLLAWARGGERGEERERETPWWRDHPSSTPFHSCSCAEVPKVYFTMTKFWVYFNFFSSRRQIDDIYVFSYSFLQNDVMKISPTIIYIRQQWKLSSTFRNCTNCCWKNSTLTPRMGYHGNCNWDGSKLLVFYGLHLQRTEHNRITGNAVQLSVEGH